MRGLATPGMQADRGRGCRGGLSFGKCAGMEAARHNGEPIHRTIVRQLRSASINGATTERGVWGFHGDHAPHGDRFLPAGRHVPAVTIVIDMPKRISAAFDIVDQLTSERGLVTRPVRPSRIAGDVRAAPARPSVTPTKTRDTGRSDDR